MIKFIAKLFIKDSDNYSDNAVREKYGFLTGIIGIILNVIICTAKIVVGALTASISVVADGINNLSDAGSSVITVFSFKLSNKPVDKKHPFGHGRLEYVAAMLVSIIIVVVGAELMITSVKSIFSPENVLITTATFIVLSISVAIKFYMFLYNFSWSKKLDSAVMKATAYDSIADAVSTTIVLLCAVIGKFSSFSPDGYAGAVVALFICFTGVRSFMEIINDLLGKPPKKEFVDEVEKFVSDHDIVCGVHDIVVHDYGPGRVMLSLHVEVPAETDILAAHDAIDTIEHGLCEKFRCHATIHMDPVMSDPESRRLRSETLAEIRKISSDITMHDFRVFEAKPETGKKTIAFDIVLPYELKMPEKEVEDFLRERLAETEPEYAVSIQIDRPFV